MNTSAVYSIPTPCHEPWDAMTPVPLGRLCGSCTITVVDVCGMGPSEARQYLAQEVPLRISRGERVCVRAPTDRSGRLVRGVTRRLLTNGLATVLAVTAAGFAGFGPDLHGAELDDGQPKSEKPGDDAPVNGPAGPRMVSVGMVVAPPLAPVVDAASGITYAANEATFIVTATRTDGTVVWSADLVALGMAKEGIRRINFLTLDSGHVVVGCMTNSVVTPIRLDSGTGVKQ